MTLVAMDNVMTTLLQHKDHLMVMLNSGRAIHRARRRRRRIRDLTSPTKRMFHRATVDPPTTTRLAQACTTRAECLWARGN